MLNKFKVNFSINILLRFLESKYDAKLKLEKRIYYS